MSEIYCIPNIKEWNRQVKYIDWSVSRLQQTYDKGCYNLYILSSTLEMASLAEVTGQRIAGLG